MHGSRLIDDAIGIWRAGIDAVRADRVVSQAISWEDHDLLIHDTAYDLRGIQRIVVVGAGKATYGMLSGLAETFSRHALHGISIQGWINVPDGVAKDLQVHFGKAGVVEVWPARPQGVNEPTERVVDGSQRILELVRSADRSTMVIGLWSGGGSALFCLPQPWISLQTKIEITRRMSACGADIHALNEVRRCLSQVKGGGLANACNARYLVGLILSDVLGDPLPIIASGPTVTSPQPNPQRAADILESYCPGEFESVVAHLRQQTSTPLSRSSALADPNIVEHHILANNATAVDAAGTHAVALGYRYWMHAARQGEGPAEALGIRLARQMVETQASGLVNCLITGGEPTVVLPDESIRGRGGRNQQLVLAAGEWLLANAPHDLEFAFLSGGTDGEDGPTLAAGAWLDSRWLVDNRQHRATIQEHLRRCDAFSFFERSGNLLVSGPTHTNVCDLRVAVIRSSGSSVP